MSSLPQVPEQKGMMIGCYDYCKCDFDMYLYEDLGLGIIERDIGTPELFTELKHTSATVKRDIRELRRLKWHCERVIEKLERANMDREL